MPVSRSVLDDQSGHPPVDHRYAEHLQPLRRLRVELLVVVPEHGDPVGQLTPESGGMPGRAGPTARIPTAWSRTS